MSILGSILSKIMSAVPGGHPSQTASAQAAPPQSSASTTATPQSVDLNSILKTMAQKSGQTLNWQSSIVDLMKLVGMDSSLTARKELAKELHYTGDMNDSAQMNIWLQKQVMQKLSENGGKVPTNLAS